MEYSSVMKVTVNSKKVKGLLEKNDVTVTQKYNNVEIYKNKKKKKKRLNNKNPITLMNKLIPWCLL